MIFSYCFFCQCAMDCQKSAKMAKFDLAGGDPKFDLGVWLFWVKHPQMVPTKIFWGSQ